MKKEPTMEQLFSGMSKFCNGQSRGKLNERVRRIHVASQSPRPRRRKARRFLREQEELPPTDEPLDDELDLDDELEEDSEKTFELDVSSFDPEDEYYVVELPQETEETIDNVLDETDVEVVEKIDLPEELEDDEEELEDDEEELELEVEKESKYVDLGPAIREWKRAKSRSIRSRRPRRGRIGRR